MKRRTFLFSGVTLLSGCAPGVWNLPSYDDLPPNKSGVAIASVGGEWRPNARFSVGFRPIASRDTVGEFYFLRQSAFARIPIDIHDGELYATVATRRLPPGRYEIYGASVMIYIGAQISYYDKRPFSFPFEVHPNTATYLGEFLGYPLRGRDALGVEKTVGAYFTVRDQRARDLALLQKRGLSFPSENVRYDIMSKAQSANSIFRRVDDAL